MNAKEQKVGELLTPTIEQLGCQFWGAELLSQGKHSKLRIYIDHQDGVSIDDCARVSRQVSDILDVEEVFSQAYTLEVSSPGMDRILFRREHFEASVGAQVDVRLNFPFNGRKKFVGVLAGVEDEQAILQVDGEEILFPIENIQRARLVPSF